MLSLFGIILAWSGIINYNFAIFGKRTLVAALAAPPAKIIPVLPPFPVLRKNPAQYR